MWLQALDPSPATGLLPPPAEAEFPTRICWMRLNASCLLLLGEGGRVFVQLGGAQGGGEVVELRWGVYEMWLPAACLPFAIQLLGAACPLLPAFLCHDLILACIGEEVN